jgi:hypothetical protein
LSTFQNVNNRGFGTLRQSEHKDEEVKQKSAEGVSTATEKKKIVSECEKKKEEGGSGGRGGGGGACDVTILDPVRLTGGDVDGEALLYKRWVDAKEAATLVAFCSELHTRLYPFGLRHNRLLWACGDPGVHHGFRGVNVDIMPWPPILRAIRDKLVRQFCVYTNFCLVNHYRNGRDAIAPHADEELFARNKSVFTLALGATRPMKLIPTGYKATKYKTVTFPFESGDLFLMCGNIQRYFKHGIGVDRSLFDVRFSLTFRSTSLLPSVPVPKSPAPSTRSLMQPLAVRRDSPPPNATTTAAVTIPVPSKRPPVLGAPQSPIIPPLRLPPLTFPTSTASTLDNPTDQKFRPSRLFDSDEISTKNFFRLYQT